MQGQALKEAQAINRSLSSLGDVICALQASAKHVPFRNSKLTQVQGGRNGWKNGSSCELQASTVVT